eukprot:1159353-Pelagomonas_calceolata.AAC.2
MEVRANEDASPPVHAFPADQMRSVALSVLFVCAGLLPDTCPPNSTLKRTTRPLLNPLQAGRERPRLPGCVMCCGRCCCNTRCAVCRVMRLLAGPLQKLAESRQDSPGAWCAVVGAVATLDVQCTGSRPAAYRVMRLLRSPACASYEKVNGNMGLYSTCQPLKTPYDSYGKHGCISACKVGGMPYPRFLNGGKGRGGEGSDCMGLALSSMPSDMASYVFCYGAGVALMPYNVVFTPFDVALLCLVIWPCLLTDAPQTYTAAVPSLPMPCLGRQDRFAAILSFANGATGRTASHEVTSGGRAARAQEAQPPLTEERKHEIAAYLQELPEEHADRTAGEASIDDWVC